MLPFLTHPLALAALAVGVPALVAIYWLRNRFRRRVVSSLMLWVDAREARAGGTRLHRLQTPLLFLLELAAILLLVFAAADPQVRATQGTRPLVVVLDDSFSMRAGGEDSPRGRALVALREELRARPPYSIRFVLAGERPQVLGEPVKTLREAERLLAGWTCGAPTSRLEQALTLAADVGGELALLLVVTDRAPAEGTVAERGRLCWWAFGKPLANVAFVNAARTAREEGERCLFEIANFADEESRTQLRIETADGGSIQRAELRLAPGETRRIVLPLKPGTPAVRAVLGDDALAIDNEVILQPAPRRALRVQLAVGDRGLRAPLEKAIRAARFATVTGRRPHLIFTDGTADPDAGEEAWPVFLVRENDALAYTGPFVMDRAHPLTDGLSLRGVIWAAGKGQALEGAPVIMAGNVPLLSVRETLPVEGEERTEGRQEARLRLRPDLSTLTQAPDWPALVWNLLAWRAAALPGLDRSNVRLGERVALTFATPVEKVRVAVPGRPPRDVPVKGKRLTLRADEPGTYEILDGAQRYAFSANVQHPDESDLRGCVGGQWGEWLDETTLRLEYRSVAWLLLLLALGVLALHWFLVARAGR
jgi:hypothetical protein